MNEIITGEAGNITPIQGDKTFSQDDVNRIISERLAKEKTKHDAALADRERELAQRELQLTAKEKLAALGWPAELADALNMSTPEALDSSITLIQKAISKINPQPFEIKGAKPAEPGAAPKPGGMAGIRQAMGLK